MINTEEQGLYSSPKCIFIIQLNPNFDIYGHLLILFNVSIKLILNGAGWGKVKDRVVGARMRSGTEGDGKRVGRTDLCNTTASAPPSRVNGSNANFKSMTV